MEPLIISELKRLHADERIIPNILIDRYGNNIYDPSEVIPMDEREHLAPEVPF